MEKSKTKFPKKIFVGRENDGEGNDWLTASETPEGMEVQNDTREVAIYELVRVAKVKNTTEVV